jgi:DNA-binding NtrC family response regulator
MAREKILVVDYDLDSLSRMYLALTHRKFKAEVCNKPEEIKQRLKRFNPAVIILSLDDYTAISLKLRIPAIVLIEEGYASSVQLHDGDIPLQKPVHADELVKAVERLI